MEHHSELERFLSLQHQEGRLQSEGQFTLALDQALKKLGSFQLPFAGAWILKMVQAAVLSPNAREIRISLTSREAWLEFDLEELSLDEVEQAFLNPDLQVSPFLQELRRGLWAVTIGQNRGVQLALPWTSESLVWNGQSLQRMASSRIYPHLYLAVTHQSLDGGLAALFARGTSHVRQSAELLQILSHCAHLCPIPIYLDRRLMNGFPVQSETIFSIVSVPVQLDFLKPSAPPLLLPDQLLGPSLKGEPLPLKGDPTGASAAVLLRANLEQLQLGKEDQKEYAFRSRILWIRHGVVTQVDLLSEPSGICTVDVFLNADDLGTDLSTMLLTSSSAKHERATSALEKVYQIYLDAPAPDLRGLEAAGKKLNRALAGGAIAAGAVTLLVNPALGLGLAGIGGAVLATQRQRAQQNANDFLLEFRSLRHRLRSAKALASRLELGPFWARM